MWRAVCEGFEQPLCGGHVVADVQTKASSPTATHPCLCCLMEDQIDTLYHRIKLKVHQITFDEGETVPFEQWRHVSPLEVRAVIGNQAIDTDHLMACIQQAFGQVRSNEACCAGN